MDGRKRRRQERKSAAGKEKKAGVQGAAAPWYKNKLITFVLSFFIFTPF